MLEDEESMGAAREHLERLEAQLRQELDQPAADDIRAATFGAPDTGATLFARGGAYRAAGSIDAIVPPPWSRQGTGNSLARVFCKENGMPFGPTSSKSISRRARAGKSRGKGAKQPRRGGHQRRIAGADAVQGDLYIGG